MKKYVIVVAGGSGQRMGTSLPKQFLCIHNTPILMHSLAAFYRYDPSCILIVALAEEYHAYWRELCQRHQFGIDHQLAIGGQTRFHSVQNALKQVDEHSLVAVHDAVRPLISTHVIARAFVQAEEKGNAIVAIASKDSVRLQTRIGNSTAIDRDSVFLVQTPQVFQSQQLKTAYQQAYQASFTDDASVVEALSYPIYVLSGESQNIKITYPEDLRFAEFVLA